MKTLKPKKLSQYIYESVGDVRGYPDLDLVTLDDIKEWLTQKQAEYLTQKDWELSIRQVFDELLEELNQ